MQKVWKGERTVIWTRISIRKGLMIERLMIECGGVEGMARREKIDICNSIRRDHRLNVFLEGFDTHPARD